MIRPSPRCRFAPSPTGYLHVGSARAALFNWLFARSTGGSFLLRIEDTDAERSRPELTGDIVDMLAWLGLDWDEEPLHQSGRLDVYASSAAALAATGAAYYCDCTAEQVKARHEIRGGAPGYHGHCRDRALGPGPDRALRFRTPGDGVTAWDDVVRGKVSFEHANLEDFVLLRSDGTPTFLLANVVDDDAMGITHVIRGEDHVNGTPKYLLIRAALGLVDQPVFAHLPLLVNEGRKKLSKRRDDVSLGDYRAKGYLPEAMANYLALLGWGPPDGVEIRPMDQIASLFRLEDVNPSPAFFDVRKLAHMNAQYIRAMPVEEFLARADPFVAHGARARGALAALGPEVQERVRTLAEAEDYVDFLWLDEPAVDAEAWAKVFERDRRAVAALEAALASFAEATFDVEELRAALGDVAMAAGYVNPEGRPQLAKAQAPVRVAVTGKASGPPLFESLAALGRTATMARLRAARERLG